MRPVLLTMPQYGSTLAAMRCLGRHGIPVTIAGSAVAAPACWSRHATRVVACPPPASHERFLEWLVEFGRKEPRHVLAACCDDMAVLMAEHRDVLEKLFDLHHPPLSAIVALLDKRRLGSACEAVGLARAPSWFPAGEDDLDAVVREATFPVILKARTQARRVEKCKGAVVSTATHLREGYRRFLLTHRYAPGAEGPFGDVSQPLIQRFFADAAARVYSLSGFVDRQGAVLTARASIKVFQRTRPVGLGVCFESAPVDDGLRAAVGRLCRAVGYYGVFEVEFVRSDGEDMLIDFNPRFFGQMAFDVARGQPLPLLLYHAACGDELTARELAARADRCPDGATIYAHRLTLEALLVLERVQGRMSAEQVAGWRKWYRDHRGSVADAAAERDDPLASHVLAASEVWARLRVAAANVNSRRASRPPTEADDRAATR